MKQENIVRNYLILSFIAALLIFALAWSFTINPIEVKLIERLEMGILFIICCVIGISLVFKPNWFHICIEQKTHGTKSVKIESKKPNLPMRGRLGHHPDCDRYQNHTIRFNNKVLCAGCTGLAIGAGLAIFLMILVTILPIRLSRVLLFAFLILGLVLIAFNFASIITEQKYGSAKLLLNVLLVLGFFLVISSIFLLAGALIFGVLGIMISILWLDTRILLSKRNHNYICKNCNIKCAEFH